MARSHALIAGAVALVALTCSSAQDAPSSPPPAAPPPAARPAQADPRKDAPPPAPDQKLHVKKCTVPGADPTGELFLAAAGKDGRREEFGAIAPDTAFEIWLDEIAPVKVATQEPDPANPGHTHAVEHLKVPVAPVSVAEIDSYLAEARSIGPVGNEGMFGNMLLSGLLEQRATILFYYEVLPGMKERLKRAVEKIDRGMPFEKVIKQNSEDDQGKMTGGYFGDNVRGENLQRYPFERIVFGLEPGDVVGPIFDKFMAYLMLCDKHTHSEGGRHPEEVVTRVVASRYAVNLLSTKEVGRLMSAMRVRSDKERFLRVLPPGAQSPPPKKFGPDDIAPIGKPEAPLKYRSLDDALDGKSRADHR